MVLYTWLDFEVGKKHGDIADELVYLRYKTSGVRAGNKAICRCPNCSYGTVYEKYPFERIGQCDYCFEEIKLN